MPIDPSILLRNQQPVQIEDPLTRYSNMLQVQRMMDQGAEYQQGLADRKSYSDAWNPDTQSFDYNKLADSGVAKNIPALQKASLEAQKAQLDYSKGQLDNQKILSDVRGTRLAQARELVSTLNANDPNAPKYLMEMVNGFSKDDVLGPYYAQHGLTPESTAARMQVALKEGPAGLANMIKQFSLGADKLLENHIIQRDNGATTDIVSVNKYGAPRATLVSSVKNTASPKNPGTKINISTGEKGQTAYVVDAQKKAVVRDDALYETAMKAPEVAANADRLADLLRKDSTIAGTAANVQLKVAELFNLVGANNSETIANTQELIAGLAKNTLGAIRSAGLGTGQGFTDKDLKMVEKAATGDFTWNKVALSRLVEMQRLAAEKASERWQRRYNSISADARGAYEPLTPVSKRKPVASSNPVVKKPDQPSVTPESVFNRFGF